MQICSSKNDRLQFEKDAREKRKLELENEKEREKEKVGEKRNKIQNKRLLTKF